MAEYPFQQLISLAAARYPGANFGFFDGDVYTRPLSLPEQRDYARLLDFAREQQAKNPLYETAFHHLLYLYVLNGSRLDALSRLERRVRGLVAGQPGLVLISGPSGIGKTSLVLALRERIAQLGARLIVVRAAEQENTPYALWRAVGDAVAAAAGSAPEALPAPIGHGAAAASSQQLIQATAAWLESAAAARPLVILLDDLHWADADSLDVLDALSSDPRKPPLLFAGTFRTEERDFGAPFYRVWPQLQRNRLFDHVELQPLTEHDTRRLATSYHGPCSPQLAAYLFARAEGHPLFTVELLADLAAQGALTRDKAGYWQPPAASVPVPTVLRQLIGQRVQRLGPDVEQLLTVAAMVGETWPLAVVEQVAGLPEEGLLGALERALGADLLAVEDDAAEVYRFTHGLFNQVLYSGQLARRRKALHAQIAQAYEARPQPDIFAAAYHYAAADRWAAALPYYREAGRRMARHLANKRALDFYQLALEAAQRAGAEIDPHVTLAIYEELGLAQQALDRQPEAEITFSRMRAAARSLGEQALEIQALVHLTHVRSALYEDELAGQTAQEALRLAEALEDPGLLGQIHLSLTRLTLVSGRLAEMDGHIAQVRRLSGENEHEVRHLLYRFDAYRAIFAGRYAAAEPLAQRSLDHARRAGAPVLVAAGHQIVSFAQIERGRYQEAYENIRAVLDYHEMADPYHHQLPRLLNQMGYLFLELGDAQEALAWDERAAAAARDAQAHSNVEMLRYSLLNIATDRLRLGRLDEALAAVAEFEAVKVGAKYTHFRYNNRYLLLLTELHLAQNDAAQALELAREARRFAQNYGVIKNVAKSHWFEGQALLALGRVDQALVQLQEAVNLADATGHGSLPYKTRLTLAQARAAAGQSPATTLAEARALLDQKRQALDGTPLLQHFLRSPWLKLVEPSRKLRASWKVETTDTPANLTPREIEVLRLVAGGATNKQIAAELHISVRTVNTHMTNILNKTGADNRTAAAVFARDHGLLSR